MGRVHPGSHTHEWACFPLHFCPVSLVYRKGAWLALRIPVPEEQSSTTVALGRAQLQLETIVTLNRKRWKPLCSTGQQQVKVQAGQEPEAPSLVWK